MFFCTVYTTSLFDIDFLCYYHVVSPCMYKGYTSLHSLINAATIRTEYKIISLAHHTHSRRFLLHLHAGSKLHSGDWVFFVYFVFCIFHCISLCLVATLIFYSVYLAIQLPGCKYLIIKLSSSLSSPTFISTYISTSCYIGLCFGRNGAVYNYHHRSCIRESSGRPILA